MNIAVNASHSLPLPDPLATIAGEKVTTISQWQKTRRPEILELFRANVYGRAPIVRPNDLQFDVREINNNAIGGKATLKRIDIRFSGPGGSGTIRLAVFIPNGIPKRAPGFLLINHCDREHIDPARKTKSPFWPVDHLVERGYFAASFYNSAPDPHAFDGFNNVVHGIFGPKDSQQPPDGWGTIAAWAWAASRVMDYFVTDKDIDAKHIGVAGHSRGGKAALWCGAQDERFALTVSNNSGCTGAAIARRRKGETVAAINLKFPHWFCANYQKFNDREHALPIDQHELIALMAPRLVYVASASEDGWADPEGEFLSCVHAGSLYELFGLPGVGATEMPKTQQPLQNGHIGYHIRDGKHDLTEYDWNCFMDFADKHWREGRQSPDGGNLKMRPKSNG